jgi:uncharacterized protein YqfA (UPF0365 family)
MFLLDQNLIVFFGLGVLILIGLILAIVFINFGMIYFRALFSGCRVSLIELVGMKFRKVDPSIIVNARIMSFKAEIDIPINSLEAHYMARGNVPNVVRAIIAANRAKINLNFERAAAIDLAGRNVYSAVQTSVNPRVIDCPDPRTGHTELSGIAKDGIEIRAKARVTVRTCMERLVGGATEETIIARVGEGIVSAIGSQDSHKRVLDQPELISQTVLAKSLDANTAFEILSIDIADLDVGENIGARLKAETAEADKLVAQAEAEERRAMAVAMEQEHQADLKKNRAIVVLAEAEVPQAMAKAFLQGNFYSKETPQS